MRFTVGRTTLYNALSIAGKAVSQNNIMPILGSYLLKINGSEMDVCASNMETFISKRINIDSNNLKVQICIPAARLLGLLKDLADQPLIFELVKATIPAVNGKPELNSYSVIIKASSGNYSMPYEEGDNFPLIQNCDGKVSEVDSADFLAAIYKVVFAVSSDGSRPAMTGVCVEFENKAIRFTATDAHKLSTILLDAETKINQCVIIPAQSLNILLGLNITGVLKISLSDNSIVFTDNTSTEISVVLIDEKAPPYKSVIPTNNHINLTINRAQFIGALKRVTPFSYKDNPILKLTFVENKTTITAENIDLSEEGKETIECQFNDEEFNIGVNGNFLISCLGKCSSENIHLLFSSPNRAILITEDEPILGNQENLMLVMPNIYISKN